MIKSFRQAMPFMCICVILIAFAFAGCGTNNALTERRPALAKIEYSNINDDDSRQLLRKLLSDAAVSEDRIQGFFSRVDSFNENVREAWLTTGFEEAKPLVRLQGIYKEAQV